jgi:succinate dehydrogenase/fumarate reductase flavoprotein subunit
MQRRSLIAALTAAVLLAGCGASGSGDGQAPLKVGSQRGGTKAILIASGALEGVPYKIEWSEFAAAQPLLEAVGAGAVDLGEAGDAPFLFAYASGAKIKAVQAGKSGGSATALLVRKGAPFHGVADLRGRKIATGRGSIGHYLLLRLLEEAGLKPTDVQIVFLNPGDAKAAFTSGAIDAWVTWGSYVALAKLHDDATVLADGRGGSAATVSRRPARRRSPASGRRSRTSCAAWPRPGAGPGSIRRNSPRPCRRRRACSRTWRSTPSSNTASRRRQDRRRRRGRGQGRARPLPGRRRGELDPRPGRRLRPLVQRRGRAVSLATDVLVIGGGLAGTWAAIAAAREGAEVVLADKGHCGTSGVTATAGPGHWWVPPEGREGAVADRLKRSLGLGDPDWMRRILDLTWTSLPTLRGYYDFSTDDQGRPFYRGLRGPEYMRAMRNLAVDQGVRILDHHPALELLRHGDGSIAGASGLALRGEQPWTIRAGGVVLATGGCAFASRLLGSATNTGDGLLMGVEAGADLSGMEFANYYTAALAGTNMARSMAYSFARWFDADDRELDIPNGPDVTPHLARALMAGPLFCRLDRVPQDIQRVMPQVQPNFVLPFDRKGIDAYRDRFEVTLHAEGTVRGIGGLRVVDAACQTQVPGLFAAGDAASRELVTGAISGGGAVNSSWALSSGQWAGAGAARLALGQGARADALVAATGRAGLRPSGVERPVDLRAAVQTVRDELNDYGRNIFRRGPTLAGSIRRLDEVWTELAGHGRGEGRASLRTREAAALVAAGRWSKASALARRETRGMHRREDAADLDHRLAARQHAGGLDQVWTTFETTSARAEVA